MQYIEAPGKICDRVGESQKNFKKNYFAEIL